MKKMKMTIKDAVEYSQNPSNDVAIHVPTRELYDKVIKYLENLGYTWYDGMCLAENRFNSYHNPCVKIYDEPLSAKDVTIDSYGYHEHCSDEIIELIEEEEPELTITIKSDGHKIITAECNGIKVQASCNDSDVFSNVGGSHLAINRLFDALDKKAKESTIEKGDIVEVVKAIHCSPEEAIGIQGIVTSTDVDAVEGIIKVNFPVAIRGSYRWNYSEDELKLVKKG